MSCLDATFTLTPRSPWFGVNPDSTSAIECYGVSFLSGGGLDLPTLYNADSLFFDSYSAADPTVDYSKWITRIKVPRVELGVWLTQYGTGASLALVFAFQAAGTGRILIFTDAGLIKDQPLAIGDNQFLLEIESLDAPFWLYFIHAGGDWLFKGISGYVV